MGNKPAECYGESAEVSVHPQEEHCHLEYDADESGHIPRWKAQDDQLKKSWFFIIIKLQSFSVIVTLMGPETLMVLQDKIAVSNLYGWWQKTVTTTKKDCIFFDLSLQKR